MASTISFGSSSFLSVAAGFVSLHRMIQEGRDEGPEADAVRDALDVPLRALSPVEKERAQWLSDDLYSVSEPSCVPPMMPMTPQAQADLNSAIEARQKKKWDLALALLRRSKDYFAPALLSYVRGRVWDEAGIPVVAAMFYEHATMCDPENANFRAIYLNALAKADPESAGQKAKTILRDSPNYAPALVVQAANIRFSESKALPDAESIAIFRSLVPILEETASRIDADEETTSRDSNYAMTVALLGFCHEFLGNENAAVESYSRGIHRNPDNDGLLVARGILLYGSGPQSISDFERAVALNCPVIWPYLFLAHHYLLSNRFDECRTMCEIGLRVEGTAAARSQLKGFQAVASAELGLSAELVRMAFEAALRLDPSNEFSRRNLAIYEESRHRTEAPPEPKWRQKSSAALRQFGLVERRFDRRLPIAA